MKKYLLVLACSALIGLTACGKKKVEELPSANTIPSPAPTTSTTTEVKTEAVAPVETDKLTITKKEYGNKWPFTVESGYLTHVGSGVYFTSGGQTYAVNGAAKSTKKYPSVDKIWREDPELPGAKVNLGDMIQKGLALPEKR